MSWKLLLLRTLFILCCVIAALSSCHTKKKTTSVAVHNKKRSAQSVRKVAAAPVKIPISKGEWHKAIGITRAEAGRHKLYSFIDEWYGVPYKYGGCRKNGVDCSCFASMLYEQVYKINIGRISQDIYKTVRPIQLSEAREGDLLFFKIGGNKISHVGVYVSNRYFIHSSTSRGVMLSSMEEAYYKKFFYAAGRVKES